MPRTARHARHDDTTLSLSFATVFVRPSTAFTHWLDGFPHSLMPASSAGVSEANHEAYGPRTTRRGGGRSSSPTAHPAPVG